MKLFALISKIQLQELGPPVVVPSIPWLDCLLLIFTKLWSRYLQLSIAASSNFTSIIENILTAYYKSQHLALFTVNCQLQIRIVKEMINELYPESKQKSESFNF